MGAVTDRQGRWRQINGRTDECLWPRVFIDDHGVKHAVLLSFDNGMTGPVMVCTGHRAFRTGVQENYPALTCLACIVKNPMMPEDDVDDVDDEA
jgi:hypothetical protein